MQDQPRELPVDESESGLDHADKIRMLSLDSPRWGELEHAYGSAADVPFCILRFSSSTPIHAVSLSSRSSTAEGALRSQAQRAA
jgi:hypothetical protein